MVDCPHGFAVATTELVTAVALGSALNEPLGYTTVACSAFPTQVAWALNGRHAHGAVSLIDEPSVHVIVWDTASYTPPLFALMKVAPGSSVSTTVRFCSACVPSYEHTSNIVGA